MGPRDEVRLCPGQPENGPCRSAQADQLFRRLTLVAQAHELHTLPLLAGMDPVILTKPMCASLLDKLGFVTDRLNDQLAHETAQLLADFVAGRLRRPPWNGSVTVEGY